MGIEPGRVVQVRTPGGPASGAAGKYRFGSGYLVADGLVLTARHVLVPPEFGQQARPAVGQSCEISFAGGVWLRASLVAAGEIDAAVLRTEALDGQWPPGRWARLVGTEPLHWDALGYPVASLGSDHREREHAYGEVSPLTGEGGDSLGLTVSSREPRVTGNPATGWAGLSGAAVICDDRIAGIITEDPAAYSRSLEGLRATAILADPALGAALGHPAAADVGGRVAPRTPSVDPDRPVLLIVDDEDAVVIGEQVSDLAQVLTARDVPEALYLVGQPGLRIDAALVDICIGEPTGDSGRSVLDALRKHRSRVPRSVISSDPFMGLFGDVTESLSKYGVYRTLRKRAPGSMTPDLRSCVEAMLRQDDEAVIATVNERIDELRDAYLRRRLIPLRNRARRDRREGGIDEAKLRDVESRVELAQEAIDDARAEAARAEADAKWETVAWLHGLLEEITAEAG
jgi:hypothetical protein